MWYMFVMYSDHSSRTLANNEKDIEVFEERLKGRQHQIKLINQCNILCSIFIWNTDGKSGSRYSTESNDPGAGGKASSRPLISTAPEYSAQCLLLFR